MATPCRWATSPPSWSTPISAGKDRPSSRHGLADRRRGGQDLLAVHDVVVGHADSRQVQVAHQRAGLLGVGALVAADDDLARQLFGGPPGDQRLRLGQLAGRRAPGQDLVGVRRVGAGLGGRLRRRVGRGRRGAGVAGPRQARARDRRPHGHAHHHGEHRRATAAGQARRRGVSLRWRLTSSSVIGGGTPGSVPSPRADRVAPPRPRSPRSCSPPRLRRPRRRSRPRRGRRTSWVGDGTPASCTSKAVVRAVAKGGVIRFRCGPDPVTIEMRRTAKVVNTSRRVVIDGGGLVTLSGGGRRRILYQNTCDPKQVWTTSHCQDQATPAAGDPRPPPGRRRRHRRDARRRWRRRGLRPRRPAARSSARPSRATGATGPGPTSAAAPSGCSPSTTAGRCGSSAARSGAACAATGPR